ncbi:MAG: glycosyltransferase family 2 protein [Candidatus Buchananbacteria bacterium]|nr:glycosyltransferase family 2 protein [Candidatus Buchananbacteria bacterium]
MRHRSITIVIVSYNGRQYLPDCLASIQRQNYPVQLVRTVVIDNNSTDSTVGYVREAFPGIKIIANRNNPGFAANNQGYFLAQKWGSEYLVLLNQDTIVDSNWLARMVECAESNRRIAAVQAKLLLSPEKHLINSYGNSLHYLGFGYCNHYREEEYKLAGPAFDVLYPSGAAVLLRMSALAHTGLIDDKLFMYHDDVDLGWRLRLRDYKVMVEPRAVVYHKYSYSKAKYKFYYMERNRLIVMMENYRLGTLILLLPMLKLMELGLLLFAIKNGWIKEKLKGYWWILTHLRSIIKRRADVQFRLRKVKDREILKLMTGSIKFQEIDSPLLRIMNPVMELYLKLVKMIIWW